MQNNNLFAEQITQKYKENVRLIKELQNHGKEFKRIIPELERIRNSVTVNVQVPVIPGETIAFMEGTLVHTNELLVRLGSNYHAKMTTTDVGEFVNRRFSDIDTKKNALQQEQKLLVERMAWLDCNNQTEIVEHYDEREEIMWRERHKKYVRKMKKEEAEEREDLLIQKPADYYFARLDELEMEEELAEKLVVE